MLAAVNWTAVAPSITAIAVVLITTVAQWKSGKADREHSRKMAHETRTQERRESAYIGTLEYFSRMMVWVDQTIEAQGADIMPSLSMDHIFASDARVLAFGSPEVRELIPEGGRLLGQFDRQRQALRDLRAGGGSTTKAAKLLAEMRETRGKVKDLAAKLQDRIADELQGSP